MILDVKGVDDGVCGLNTLTKGGVKVILIDALARNGAVKAAEAAALEWEISNIENSGFFRENGAEAFDHCIEI